MRVPLGNALRFTVMLFVANALALGGVGYELSRTTMDGGGVMLSEGGGFELSATIGQPDAAALSGNGISVAAGFWLSIEAGSDNPVVSTVPAAGTTLSAAGRNHIKITFQETIACAVPAPGGVVIQELVGDPPGTFGPDLSASFLFGVNGTALTIDGSDPSVLVNKTWYRIANLGDWPCGDRFDIDFLLQIGDADNNGFVNFTDLRAINESIPTLQAGINDVNVRRDIDGTRFINFTDLSVANAHIPSFPVEKPKGHQ